MLLPRPRTRIRALIACVVTILLATACKSNKEEPVARVSPPDLQIVSRGSEPRTLLRYHAASGTTKSIEVAIDVELTAGEVGGPMPTILMAMTLTVTGTLPNGDMKLRATIDNLTAKSNPKSKVPAAALMSGFKPLIGLAINSTLAPDGRLRDSQIDRGGREIPKELDTQLDALITSFQATMMPLPDEPVGPGAVWRNSRPITQNGLKLKAVNTITVSAVRGDTLEYTSETDMHGDDQTVTQGDTTLSITDIIGNGSGKGTIDLATLAITGEIIAQFQSKMTASGELTATKMEMATLMKVRPLAAPAVPAPDPMPAAPADANGGDDAGSAQGEHNAP